ncbi:RICIN domain-containing protein [Microvirga sp. STR05]|uniref:RICIN domain-containing protein n=1 Tax=Hymenobacter duratus TaxID=2771356 RepID=A0ABR8JL11_9BACT|nr:RICIN domain-containing protein [Hymenobacter duratus]MBD2715484.1 RICIN domain-containing protein [Hymenobacter duratus]MBR7950392.1 RICIN domain-containing protein [Microvirga sp. STR05]
MTLIVPNDRPFVIIPKHSNLPLAPTHHRKEQGTAIQQQEAYKNNPAQQFQLRKNGSGEHLVYLPYSNLFWATAGGPSSGEGAALIQWLDQNTTNQRFRFLYAGNGYYYLRPVHAGGLVLEVPGATHGQDTLKLGKLAAATSRDHQLFRVVPASPFYVANEAHTFRQYSDLIRDAILGAISAIPKVGGAVKGVLGVLWPDGHDKDFWNQTTLYVEQRVRELLQAEHLKNLASDLQGARQNADEYGKTSSLVNKLSKLISAISSATQREDTFLRDQEGVGVLPMLAAWGTLVLTLRAEMVKEYDTLHPNETADEKRSGKADELTFLQSAIARYSAAVQRSREAAMAWRLGKIKQKHIEDWEIVDIGTKQFNKTAWNKDSVTDEYDGWQMYREYRQHNPNPGDPNSHANISYAKQARQAQVQAKFGAELDAMLAQAYLWPYLDPTKTAQPSDQRIQVAVGTFGGRPGGTPFNVPVDSLMKFSICFDASHHYVCGLNLTFAGSGTTLLRGTMGGRQNTITLQPGEYFTNVRGYEWDQIEGLVLETNYGQLVEGGQLGGHSYFEAGIDDALNAKLMSISGTYQGDVINTLTFHWEYVLSK